MARPKNNVETVQITMSVTAAVRDALEHLSGTGYFGKNAADTASVLLREKIRELMQQPGLGLSFFGQGGASQAR